MAKRLTKLKINEISTVDRGAGEGVNIVLRKRAVPTQPESASGSKVSKADAAFEYMQTRKREFTAEQRRAMSVNGQAMKTGGFPIQSRKDLKNAVRAIGRAKKPNKTKAHIIDRAHAIGHTDVLPDSWKTAKAFAKLLDVAAEQFTKAEGGEEPAAALTELKEKQFAKDTIVKAYDDIILLNQTISKEDTSIEDGTALCKQFIEKLGPPVDPKEFSDVKGPIDTTPKNEPPKKAATSVGSGSDKGKNGPGVEEEVDPEVNKATLKADKWKGLFKALRKASKDDKEYMDHPDNDMDEDDVKKYLLLDLPARTAYRDANPIGKLTEKRMNALPEPLRKAMEAGMAAQQELAKRVEAETAAEFTKRAGTDLSLPAAAVTEVVPHLVALHKASPEAADAVMKTFKQQIDAMKAAMGTNLIFKEFGTARGADVVGGSAYDQLMSKAELLMGEVNKSAAKKITKEQAFAQVYEDPSNRELVMQSKREGSVAA